MESVQTTTQIDYLKDIAGNRWFVLGAYFFAFFPWMVMSNIDFISEKWRTCRRTRNLARIHVALSIFPIIYVAVYAEAQRRDGDDKELGAALAALMFNVFQLMRTIMGILQLNAFVVWCKDAVLCMRALLGEDKRVNEQDIDSRANTCDEGTDSSSESDERRGGGERGELDGSWTFEKIAACCKRGVQRMGAYVRRCSGNYEQSRRTDEENSYEDQCIATYVEEDVEEVVEVNNSVIDNELGGREVTVLPSWQKTWNGLKKGSFEPSRWLWTDRVMLNTVRWGGTFLCGMGEHWSVDKEGSRDGAETLQMFFSREMENVRGILQFVEWNIGVGNGSRELFSISELENEYGHVELTGEMSTAYGTGCWYTPRTTNVVDLYSFEFNSLVSSYPLREHRRIRHNRESVIVKLAHSVVLAKHLGVEKLKAIRRYYDGHHVPGGRILRDAFRRLLEQTESRIPEDDACFWWMFEPCTWSIPLFPYRMQAVALWDEATNWRVLQASAHQDILLSLSWIENGKRILGGGLHKVDIFNYCAEWTAHRTGSRSLLGVVMETVRTFLAEWIVASAREPIWEPKVPKDSFEFGLVETSACFETAVPLNALIWECQRELQRKVAQTWSEDENMPGNAALVMLFVLGFPFLRMRQVQDAKIGVQESQDEQSEQRALSSSNRERNVDVNVQVWRVGTVLAPQDISLMIRIDSMMRTVALSLQTSSNDGRFIWQDWVDAAMGYMKGVEERAGGSCGYGRQLLRADLRKPIVELCPLRVDEEGIEKMVKKTSTARVWLGWPVFDVGICKFEMDQWLAACDINVNRNVEPAKRQKVDNEVAQAEQEITKIIRAGKEVMEGSAQGSQG